ncbi:MAG: O-antigen ligase family protein [Acutalibacteraceae bacterium]|nr:O-antigen ligase family protein [Acutalibacteraceae bacterium]
MEGSIKIENRSKIITYLLALFFMVIPFDYVLPHIGNATVLTPIGLIICAFAAFGVLGKRATMDSFQLVVLWLIVLSITGMLWAEDANSARSQGISFASTAIMYFLLFFYSFSKKEITIFENASILGGILLVLYVLTQADLDAVYAGYRLKFSSIGSEFFSDPNGLAARLVLPFVFTMKRLLEKGNLLIKFILLLSLAGMFYVFFLTGSRAAMIVLAVVCLIILFGVMNDKRSGAFVAIVLIFSLALIIAPMILPEHIMERIFNIDKYKEVTEIEGDRIDIWKNVILEVFPKSPIWGHGTGNSAVALKEVYGHLKAVHNSWLVFLAELGILGFFPWVVFTVSRISQAANMRRKNPYVFAALMGVLIMAATLNSEREKYLWNGFLYVHMIYTMSTKKQHSVELEERG